MSPSPAKPSFFAELQRRNVYKVGAMYAVAGWLLVQVVTQVLPIFEVSALIQRIIVLVIVAGFPVALVLSWIYELTPQGIVKTDEVTADASITHHTGQRLNRAIIGVLLLAVLVLLAKLFWPKAGFSTASAPARASAPGAGEASAAAKTEQSIAVLPLSNDSGDKDQQYFSDGLSEDLITALSQFAGLKVISRNSSFRFRDSRDDAKTIGAALGVAHLLEGSVRRVGNDVRVSTELVNVLDGSALWSEHYDRPYTDLFKLQDDITAAVAAALKMKLVTGDVAVADQRDRPPSGNLDAYKALLQGKFYLDRGTAQDLRRAIDYFTTALRLHPDYALAHADLAVAQTFFVIRYPESETGPVDAIIASARTSADTALRLQPTLANAHAARGFILATLDLDFAAGAAEAARAVELDPQNAAMLTARASSLLSLGEFDASFALTRRAIALDPLSAGAYANLASGLAALGRYEEAESIVRQAIELQPQGSIGHVWLAQIQVMRGDRTALATAQAEADAFYRDYALAFVHARLGDRASGDAALQRLIACCSGTGAFQIASVYAARRETDKTFEWLERARTTRDSGLSLLYRDPFILELRHDPRFAAFATRIGLPPLPAAAAGH